MVNLTYTTCCLYDTHFSVNKQNYCQHCGQITYISNNKRTWYCSLCDENINATCKTGYINSVFHKRREWSAFTVNKNEFQNPVVTRKVELLTVSFLKI